MPTGAGPTGWEATLQKFLTYAFPIGQMIFWIALIVVLFLAYRELKRLVSHYAPTGKGRRALAEEEIKIEDFVD